VKGILWVFFFLLIFNIGASFWGALQTSKYIDALHEQLMSSQNGSSMASTKIGPVGVETTIEGVTVTVPVSVTVTQGEDVPENVATPKDSETDAQLSARAFDTLAARVKYVKTNGT